MSQRDAVERARREFATRFGIAFGAPLGALAFSQGGWLWTGITFGFVLLFGFVLFTYDLIRAWRIASPLEQGSQQESS